VSKPKTTLAFLAYLLSVLGWLYVLLFQREDKLAVYHAKQSLGLTLAAIGAFVGWALGAWILSWIPLVGPLIAAALFAQLILVYLFLGAAWIIGMVYALQAKVKSLPLIGRWVERFLPEVGPRSDRTPA
jgi:uncharacterized membrane protein